MAGVSWDDKIIAEEQMSLRMEWEGEAETPQLLERALIDRFRSANELLAQGEWDVAIYQYGYVAEMVLKTAYFRVIGNNPADPVAAMLRPARNAGNRLSLGIPDENYHSLRFWSELLRAERRQQNRPLPSVIEMYLIAYTRDLYLNWMVEMRYHPNRATRPEAVDVAEAADWLFNNRAELGR
ncbi:MAG: hypothetical protein H7145_07295 [Akkermansiaceae bacterium]|nr:hypothetical protein [Armatimonadota bacterium]